MTENLFIIKQLIEKEMPNFTGSIEIHMCNGEVGQINQKVSTRYEIKKKKAPSSFDVMKTAPDQPFKIQQPFVTM